MAARSSSSNLFAGATFCVSGKFSVPKRHISQLIEEHGGVVTAKSDKSCSYLVSDSIDSSKALKAQKGGVPVVTEAWLTASIAAGKRLTDKKLFLSSGDGGSAKTKAAADADEDDDEEEEEEEDEKAPKKKKAAVASKKKADDGSVSKKKKKKSKKESAPKDAKAAKKQSSKRKKAAAAEGVDASDDEGWDSDASLDTVCKRRKMTVERLVELDELKGRALAEYMRLEYGLVWDEEQGVPVEESGWDTIIF